MITKLYIEEEKLRFSYSHYIQGHNSCGCIHGHTGFIKGFVIVVNTAKLVKASSYLDFGRVKNLVKDNLDHRFIVPEEHAKFWRGVYLQAIEAGIDLTNSGNIKPIPYDIATIENIADYLKKLLLDIPGVEIVRFRMSEGPSQGVFIQ